MPLYASKTAFSVEPTVPVLLGQQVNNNDILVYDATSGFFTNASFGSTLLIDNTGIGVDLASIASNTISVKTLQGGSNITLDDNGSTVTINNSSTAIVANMAALTALGPSSDIGASALVLNTGFAQPGLFIWNGTWITAEPIPSLVPQIVSTGTSGTITAANTLFIWQSFTVGPKTGTIPAANATNSGQTIIVKDAAYTSGTYSITINPVSGTIEGKSALVINFNGASYTLMSDGVSNWVIV